MKIKLCTDNMSGSAETERWCRQPKNRWFED